MNTNEAIAILAGVNDGNIDKARSVLCEAVLEASETGDPTDSMMDWIANGDYSPTDTVGSIAAEWDAIEPMETDDVAGY